MSLAEHRASLRAAIALRDDTAARIRDLRGRLTPLETERDAANDAASMADAAYREALEAEATGATAGARGGVLKLKDAASAAWAKHEERELAAGLVAKAIKRIEGEHAEATRATARAAEDVSVALATQRETELRAAARVFAEAKRDWHRAARAAEIARFNATGARSSPVRHWEPAPSLLRGARHQHDEGLVGIFRACGLDERLYPLQSGIVALTEAELLGNGPNHLEGAALTATETA